MNLYNLIDVGWMCVGNRPTLDRNANAAEINIGRRMSRKSTRRMASTGNGDPIESKLKSIGSKKKSGPEIRLTFTPRSPQNPPEFEGINGNRWIKRLRQTGEIIKELINQHGNEYIEQSDKRKRSIIDPESKSRKIQDGKYSKTMEEGKEEEEGKEKKKKKVDWKMFDKWMGNGWKIRERWTPNKPDTWRLERGIMTTTNARARSPICFFCFLRVTNRWLAHRDSTH